MKVLKNEGGSDITEFCSAYIRFDLTIHCVPPDLDNN